MLQQEPETKDSPSIVMENSQRSKRKKNDDEDWVKLAAWQKGRIKWNKIHLQAV